MRRTMSASTRARVTSTTDPQVRPRAGLRRRLQRMGAACTLALLGLVSSDARAIGGLHPIGKRLVAPDPAALEMFGTAVAIQGDLAAVGAPGDDQIGNNAGAVFIFRRSGLAWVQEAKLLGSVAGDLYGASVALTGTPATGVRLLVGAPNATAITRGAAFVYTRVSAGNWGTPVQLHSLASPALVDQDAFGSSVAVSSGAVGTFAIIGAPGNSGAGLAHVFRLNGSSWVQDGARLAGTVAQTRFGQAVAIDGANGFALVSSQGTTSNPGAVFSFQRVTSPSISWGSGPALSASLANFDGFGRSIAMSGNWALIGAPGADGSRVDAGAVHFFQRTGSVWSGQPRKFSTNQTEFGEYGSSVAISDDRALVGAPNERNGDGHLYVLSRNGTNWGEAPPMFLALVSGGYLGASAALSAQGEAISGAWFETCVECGSAYVFEKGVATPVLGRAGAWLFAALLSACGSLLLARQRRGGLARA